jgi:hypothetical protein
MHSVAQHKRDVVSETEKRHGGYLIADHSSIRAFKG